MRSALFGDFRALCSDFEAGTESKPAFLASIRVPAFGCLVVYSRFPGLDSGRVVGMGRADTDVWLLWLSGVLRQSTAFSAVGELGLVVVLVMAGRSSHEGRAKS